MTDDTGARTLQQSVEQAKAGDETSFESLVCVLEPRIFAYVKSRIRDRDEAIHITQDVFIDMWKSFQSFTYTSDAQLYAFIYTIAKRKMFRVWGRKTHTSLEEILEIPDPQAFTSVALNDDVKKEIKKLDAHARDIITLRHWNEHSFKEIGVIMKMSEGAVRVRHHRALAQLKELLHDYA